MSTPPTTPPQIGQNLSGALDEVVKGAKTMGASLKGFGGSMTGGIETAGRGIETIAAAPVRWTGRFMQNHPRVSAALIAVGIFKIIATVMEKHDAKKGAVLESASGNELPGVYDQDPHLGAELPKYSLKEQEQVSGLAEREQRRREQQQSQGQQR